MKSNQKIKPPPQFSTVGIYLYKNNQFHYFIDGKVYTYSINKNNEWICKSIHSRSGGGDYIEQNEYGTRLFNVEDDILYLTCNNYIYGWNILTERSFRVYEFVRKEAKVIKTY
jgi:hypothetical protein